MVTRNRTLIEIEGEKYHAEEVILDDGAIINSPIYYVDTGEMVPADVCVCGAESIYQCECGAWERMDEEEE